MRYVYIVWLEDGVLPSDDPDFEWPACFVIDGSSEKTTRDWGDQLARRYAQNHGQRFIRSAVEPVECSTLPGVDSLPIISEGQEASDDKIGW
jgi:hypothetical protein